MTPVRLTGPRLALRELHGTPEEAAALHAVYGDPETVRHLAFEPADLDTCADQLALALDLSEEHPRTGYRLAVTRHADGPPETAPLIGSAVLTVESAHAASIGYALRRDTWGRGHGGEVTELLCTLAFRTLGLARLAARVDPANTASARLLLRAGFQLEGRVRRDLRVGGRWCDSDQYSLLDDEWPGPVPARG
ncbi:GNAT family N-acetyltransferase [Kitasatospora albolonga]|uniref:GNAT family N-acetyltransferase n=1 Tax=Kitasatospora albolonga TaxID=68173 RepID=UPI0031E68024